MKGRPRTATEKRFHDQLCTIVGCAACRIDGRKNFYCGIHHIEGRTKPQAHWLVIPLCNPGHHQHDSRTGLTAIHPWKTRFVAKYGKERDLLRRCIGFLLAKGIRVPAEAIAASGYTEAQPC